MLEAIQKHIMAKTWTQLGIDYTETKYSEKIASFEVETDSLHSFKDLYKRIYDWLVFEDYLNTQNDEPDKYEILYWEKQHAAHKEHQIWWRGYKRPVKDIDSDYFFYFLKINFQTIKVAKGEVMYKGKKFSTNDANVIIRVNSYLIVNDKDWSKDGELFGSFLKAMQPRFRNWLYKDKIWYHRDFLRDKTFELQNVIKEFLGERLSRDLPPNIYKEKGLG
jgi:hypothetical protein